MNGEQIRVLVIDDEPFHAESVAESLERVGYDCTLATSGREGLGKIEAESWDVVLTDLKMADVDGLTIVRKTRELLPEAEVVVITGYADIKTAVEAIKLGAANYLTKPVEVAELRAILEKASEKIRLTRQNENLRKQLDEKFGFEGVIGESRKMHEVIVRLQQLAPASATTVLILGENGTGKELVAKALHRNSPRKNKPFIAMNCTASNENLLDDDLFGHEPGAFTGGDRLRKGRFEAANGGTLFLDEIGDMPLNLQAKLLRVLQEREVVRLGSNDPIKVDVRVLAATNHDLEAMVAAGTFRRDLYHRLKVATVKLPPLRERREDIALLASHFLKEFNTLNHKNVQTIAEPVRRAMLQYAWPGNVRELRNVIESAVIQDTDGVIKADDVADSGLFVHGAISPALAGAGQSTYVSAGPDPLVGRPLSEVERHYIEKALELSSGNREEAARLLCIGERTLYRTIQDWQLQDQIKAALEKSGGDVTAAAQLLGLKPAALSRKLKKLGLGGAVGDEDDGED
jgi:two-component system response regulator HydG